MQCHVRHIDRKPVQTCQGLPFALGEGGRWGNRGQVLRVILVAMVYVMFGGARIGSRPVLFV